jgi:hypothetical protein
MVVGGNMFDRDCGSERSRRIGRRAAASSSRLRIDLAGLQLRESLVDGVAPVERGVDADANQLVAAATDRVEQVAGCEGGVGTPQDGEELAFPRSELCPLSHW